MKQRLQNYEFHLTLVADTYALSCRRISEQTTAAENRKHNTGKHLKSIKMEKERLSAVARCQF